MGNEGARKLALSTLRFEQYTPLDPSLSLRMTPSFLLPTVHLPTKILTTNHQPLTIPHTSKTQLFPFSRLSSLV